MPIRSLTFLLLAILMSFVACEKTTKDRVLEPNFKVSAKNGRLVADQIKLENQIKQILLAKQIYNQGFEIQRVENQALEDGINAFVTYRLDDGTSHNFVISTSKKVKLNLREKGLKIDTISDVNKEDGEGSPIIIYCRGLCDCKVTKPSGTPDELICTCGSVWSGSACSMKITTP